MFIRKIAAVDRVCAGCGVTFKSPAHINQLRCRADCGRVRTSESRNGARAKARADYRPEFIGVDGEGVTHADGRHEYVLLSIGEQSFHKEGKPLLTSEIFGFLWDCFEENPRAVYVGYYLGYDFTQWFKGLPQDRAEVLFNSATRQRTKSGGNTTPFPVYWTDENGTDWEFDTLALKRFKLRKAGATSWLNVCDVGGFYQQPFAQAYLDWRNRDGSPIEIATPDELKIIEEGKANRATAKFNKAMIRYNVTENRVLARMMTTMAEGFASGLEVQLQKQQWFGPGQVAQKWMDAHNSHKAKVLHEKATHDKLFSEVMDAARKAYYGGWFETFAHGHVRGRSYEYDIASAYPHIQSNLPCLLHGNWTRYNGGKTATAALVLLRATVEGSNPFIGAMLHRDAKGRINRPNYSSGWYWQHELDAAKRAGLIDRCEIHEGFSYTPCKCAPPMAGLRELYAQRLAVGKSTPQGRGLKLGYNSCYGKTAQSIGQPKYANPIHASLITAGCRTMILDAIATHPNGARDVLMIATDGIYFASPHPGLENQEAALGNWEGERRENLSIFLPGVYWCDKAREGRAKKVAKLKSRGVSGADLIERLDDLDLEFDRMLREPIPYDFLGNVPNDFWPKLTLPIRFSMVSPKQALQRGKWETAGAVTQGGSREIYAHPRHKRDLVFEPSEQRPYIHTGRPRNLDRAASTPYSRLFGMELEARTLGDLVLTPEGDAISEAYEIIKGD